MPRKAKRSKKGVAAKGRTRASNGTSNLMPQASSQGHSVHLEPQPHLLEPTPPQAPVPPLGSTPHSLAPPSAPLGSAPHALAPPSAPTRQPHTTKSLSSSTRRESSRV